MSGQINALGAHIGKKTVECRGDIQYGNSRADKTGAVTYSRKPPGFKEVRNKKAEDFIASMRDAENRLKDDKDAAGAVPFGAGPILSPQITNDTADMADKPAKDIISAIPLQTLQTVLGTETEILPFGFQSPQTASPEVDVGITQQTFESAEPNGLQDAFPIDGKPELPVTFLKPEETADILLPIDEETIIPALIQESPQDRPGGVMRLNIEAADIQTDKPVNAAENTGQGVAEGLRAYLEFKEKLLDASRGITENGEGDVNQNAESDIAVPVVGEGSKTLLSTSGEDGGITTSSENERTATAVPKKENNEGSVFAIKPEVRTEQSAEAPQVEKSEAVRQPDVQNIIDQIVKGAELTRKPGFTGLEINLKPEFLGKISLLVSSTEEGMKLSIKVASDSVRQMIAAGISELQESFRASGINMQEINVTGSEIGWGFTQYDGEGSRYTPQDRKEQRSIAGLGKILATQPPETVEQLGAHIYANSSQTVYNGLGEYGTVFFEA